MSKYLKQIFIFLVIYALIFGFYLLVSPNIGIHAFGLHSRRFIPATLACILPYLLFKEFHLKNFKTEILLSVLWAVTSPYLAYIDAKTNGGSPSFPYDVATGAYLFSTLAFAKILIKKYCDFKIIKFSYYLLQLLLFIVPVFHILYYLKFGHSMSANGMMVIFQTNPSEALEYLSSLNWQYLASAFVLLVAFILIIFNNIGSVKFLPEYIITKKKLIISCIILPAVAYYTFFSLIPRTQFINIAINTREYFKTVEEYGTIHDEILKDLQVESIGGALSSSPNTIIMVIGESATRNYMKAFNKNNDETTPWLSANKNEFLLFNNSYSCAWNTVPALEHALTEANYYNNKEFNRSISIIDIAKKAGYKTYWFSNQGRIGIYDTPITMVAETCDVAKWGGDSNYDEGLLMHLKTINPNEKNFIVLHIMGSHIDYHLRYPKEYQIWTDPDTYGRLADYKNSLVYTDKVLQDYFEYAKDNLNLNAFIYFSDHGTDPNRSRDPDETKFICLRIPLFVYLSESYKENNPYITAALSANQNKFFSNDLIYNLVCGILNIKSNHYNEEESLASPKYKFNIENTKAGLGTKSVKDDPYLNS